MNTHVRQRAIYAQPVPRDLRTRVERAIERLIALLDRIDGDPDLEPSLGFSPPFTPAWLVDCEEDAGDQRELDVDFEPILAAAERPQDQRFWAAGGDDDREEDPADGPQIDALDFAL